jgi:uncharacterized RmlC-like cupin family protein
MTLTEDIWLRLTNRFINKRDLPMSAEGDRMGSGRDEGVSTDVVTVRPEKGVMTRQRLSYFMGISAATAGAKGICMHMVVIPPGASSEPHRHVGYETAIYVLDGRVETRYGAGLQQTVINQAGDFVFIAPDVPHQAFNLSTTEPVRAIVARNDPNEQESVAPYDPQSSA